MKALVLLAMLAPPQTDTLVLSVSAALEAGVGASPTLEAAAWRASSAASSVAQSAAWPNPVLAVTAENMGRSTDFTGVPGAEGLEGQAVLRFGLPLGPERTGARRVAEGRMKLTDAEVQLEDVSVRRGILVAIASVLRDQRQEQNARQELETLTDLAEALAQQAALGRTSLGDAARADLARGMASTRAARRAAALAVARAQLSRILGFPPTTTVRLATETCVSTAPGILQPGWRAPELEVADARLAIARGGVVQAKGIRLPDVQPEVGLRRTGGRSGLYVGLTTGLPLFDRGSRRVEAAEASALAAQSLQSDAERRWEAEREGARGVLAALTVGGTGFDAEWFANLERAVVAAEARYTLGEGSLMELLDSRRSRLQALDDYVEWQSEWWTARIDAARLDGGTITPDLVCTDPFREVVR